MKKAFFLPLICFFLMFLPLKANGLEDVIVSAQANEYAVTGSPIVCSIMVTHESDQKIDERSFKLGKDPIKVEFIKNVQISPDSKLIISIYKFTIDPKMPGSYTLPSVSVNVGGNVYSSYESFYDVQGGVF